MESEGIVDQMRVKLLPLPVDPSSNLSAPNHVLERMEDHCAKVKMREAFDHHWLVLDVDSWKPVMLSEVVQAARQKGFGVAISNPCFELWIILHETADLSFLEGVVDSKRSSATKQRLRDLRAQGLTTLSTASLETAVSNAQRLDPDDSARWPQQCGSHLYKLVDALAAQGVMQRPKLTGAQDVR